MNPSQRLPFSVTVLSLISATLTALVASGIFTLELFLIVSLVTFLAAVELTAPSGVAPTWRTQLRWLSLFGLLALGVVVIRRAINTLPEEFIPWVMFA